MVRRSGGSRCCCSVSSDSRCGSPGPRRDCLHGPGEGCRCLAGPLSGQVADGCEVVMGGAAAPPGAGVISGRFHRMRVPGAGRPLDELEAGEVVLDQFGDVRGELAGWRALLGAPAELEGFRPQAKEESPRSVVTVFGECPAGVRWDICWDCPPEIIPDPGAGLGELGRYVVRWCADQVPGAGDPHAVRLWLRATRMAPGFSTGFDNPGLRGGVPGEADVRADRWIFRLESRYPKPVANT